jgi:hypothetical protein
MCCQVEVSTTGLSLVQRAPNGCGVYECDDDASKMRRQCSTRACRAMGRGGNLVEIHLFIPYDRRELVRPERSVNFSHAHPRRGQSSL